MLAVSFSLLFLVMLINYIAVEYGRGMMRSAADEGARAGARVAADPNAPLAACRAREESVVGTLGTMADDLTFDCQIVGTTVRAEVSARFPGWLPWVPDFTSTAVATSASEQAQAPQ